MRGEVKHKNIEELAVSVSVVVGCNPFQSCLGGLLFLFLSSYQLRECRCYYTAGAVLTRLSLRLRVCRCPVLSAVPYLTK